MLGQIPFEPEISKNADMGKPFFNSKGESAKIFRDIVEKILKKINVSTV